MKIINSTMDDVGLIFDLYDAATTFQKTRSDKHWQSFSKELVEKEIAENRQWKMIVDNNVVCIFAVAYTDPLIWGEKDKDPSIYIHRIATNPNYRGKNNVVEIIKWAKLHGKENGKKYIRIDTWADNPKLVEYYIKCGFDYKGDITPTPGNLPKHYDGITLALFEIEI